MVQENPETLWEEEPSKKFSKYYILHYLAFLGSTTQEKYILPTEALSTLLVYFLIGVSWVLTFLILIATPLSFILDMMLKLPSIIPYILAPSIMVGIALLIILIYNIPLRKTYNYRIDEWGVHFKGGFLEKTSKSIPFEKITDLTISQNPVQQLLNIYDVNIETASSKKGEPEMRLIALENPKKPERIILEKLEGK